MKASKLVKELERMIERYGDREVCLWEVDVFEVVNKEVKWIQTTAEGVTFKMFQNDFNFKCELDGQEVFMIEK